MDWCEKYHCKILLFYVIFYKNVKNEKIQICKSLMDNEKTKLLKNGMVVSAMWISENFQKKMRFSCIFFLTYSF